MADMGIIAFVRAYRADAVQLTQLPIAREWHRIGMRPAVAAAWANAGFLPGEALPNIAEGVTPELVMEIEQAAHAVWGDDVTAIADFFCGGAPD